jgi:chitin synthase
MAITETETLCKRFISARSKTALLYSYRLMTKSGKYIFMCVKHQNQGKLWSHNWFFNGFCQVMKPEQTILMDVGLTPAPDALFKMYNYLQHHPECGGVCGYMALSIEKPEYISLSDLDIFTRIGAFFFDIQKAQQFEYHFSHMLDKPFEAAFGFIHVLPGAFSGYNMNELFLNDNTILK